jgi:histidinol-phosphate phosphatase family protein
VILLDRDGVLNVDRVDSVRSIADLEVETGAVEGCRLLHEAGYPLGVISNQSAVGRGWMTAADLEVVNAELDRRLGGVIDAWFVCPHAPDTGCRCRKPGTLLLEQARDAYGFDPAAQYLRVRGAAALGPQGLGVLRELTIWRDAAARAHDLPPRAFLRDEILTDMARTPVRSVARVEHAGVGVRHPSIVSPTVCSASRWACSARCRSRWRSASAPPAGSSPGRARAACAAPA